MFWLRSGLAIALAFLSSSAFGQSRYPVKILDARVGLPPGRFVGERDEGRAANVVKTNCWAPVYVWLEVVKEIRRDAAIVVETTDTDDLITRTFVPLQNLSAEQPGTRLQPVELRFMPYVRCGGQNEVRITVAVPDSGSPDGWSSLSAPYIIRNVRTRDTSKYVVLSLGSNLPGLLLPKEEEQEDAQPGATYTGKALRGGRIETAAITNVAEMPDQWFGYDGADLVVLCTGTDDKFLTSLFTDPTYKTRLDALLEWVRRGGRLVVSVGRNAALAAQFPVLQEILPVNIQRDDPTAQVKQLSITWGLGKTNDLLSILAGKNGAPFTIANVTPKADRSHRSLVPSPDRKGVDDRPTVLQSAFGLGRVTLCTIDLDRSPFVDYAARAKFWDNLLSEAGADRASKGSSTRTYNTNPGYSSYGASDNEDDLTSGLRSYIDRFEGVPVISFGWVAVFILLYTLLIGPIEYYFLKKVLKRLELTWITFPIIVLTVSAIAYFTAYAIKGNDLKLNKVDVIDIDPASGRIYGRMWLTVFSPRIDTYRIGMKPNPGWAEGVNESPTAGSLVDWFGVRSGSRSILRRNYWYHVDPPGGTGRNPYDDGLVDVPIPVWSTKSFSADWSATLDKEAPLVVSNLIHPPADPRNVVGTFTLNVPLDEIKEAYVIYAGKAYKLANAIRPGVPVPVVVNEKEADLQWLTSFDSTAPVVVQEDHTPMGMAPKPAFNTNKKSQTPAASTGILAGLLFHEQTLTSDASLAPRNGTLRRLDQSWRLSDRNRDEVIVVARLPQTKGLAEEVLTAKNSASPTQLWLKELPGDGKPRSPVPGTLQQDTFLRVYVPIKR